MERFKTKEIVGMLLSINMFSLEHQKENNYGIYIDTVDLDFLDLKSELKIREIMGLLNDYNKKYGKIPKDALIKTIEKVAIVLQKNNIKYEKVILVEILKKKGKEYYSFYERGKNLEKEYLISFDDLMNAFLDGYEYVYTAENEILFNNILNNFNKEKITIKENNNPDELYLEACSAEELTEQLKNPKNKLPFPLTNKEIKIVCEAIFSRQEECEKGYIFDINEDEKDIQVASLESTDIILDKLSVAKINRTNKKGAIYEKDGYHKVEVDFDKMDKNIDPIAQLRKKVPRGSMITVINNDGENFEFILGKEETEKKCLIKVKEFNKSFKEENPNVPIIVTQVKNSIDGNSKRR